MKQANQLTKQARQAHTQDLLATHPANPYPAPGGQRVAHSALQAAPQIPSQIPSQIPAGLLGFGVHGVNTGQSGQDNPYPEGSLSHELIENNALAMLLADKPVVMHRSLLLLMNGCREAFRNAYVLTMLLDLIKTLPEASGGWFSMDTAQWGELTDCSYAHHLAARKALIGMGFLTEHSSGYPAEKVYRVEVDAIYNAIAKMAKSWAADRQAAQAAVVRH